MKLFLDDERSCPEGWECVRNYGEFKDFIISRGMPEVISFDHDLGLEHYRDAATGVIDYSKYVERTGYDCAKLLVEWGEYPKFVIVHSFNPVGARNISDLLSEHTVVTIQPYHPAHYWRQ